jgi:hypothetical protein
LRNIITNPGKQFKQILPISVCFSMIVVMTYLWRVRLKYISPSVSITQRPQFRYNKSVVVAINVINPYLID